jgi:HSP20 family protein
MDMAGLIIWKNEELNKIKRDLDRLMNRLRDEMDGSLFPVFSRRVPSVDLAETDQAIVIRVALPDMKPEDLHIALHGDVLQIRGEVSKKVRNGDDSFGFREEHHYSSFERVIPLPCRVSADETEATFKDGVLRIVMPKCKPDRARILEIKQR